MYTSALVEYKLFKSPRYNFYEIWNLGSPLALIGHALLRRESQVNRRMQLTTRDQICSEGEQIAMPVWAAGAAFYVVLRLQLHMSPAHSFFHWCWFKPDTFSFSNISAYWKITAVAAEQSAANVVYVNVGTWMQSGISLRVLLDLSLSSLASQQRPGHS